MLNEISYFSHVFPKTHKMTGTWLRMRGKNKRERKVYSTAFGCLFKIRGKENIAYASH
jgi:hypothetical protein